MTYKVYRYKFTLKKKNLNTKIKAFLKIFNSYQSNKTKNTILNVHGVFFAKLQKAARFMMLITVETCHHNL